MIQEVEVTPSFKFVMKVATDQKVVNWFDELRITIEAGQHAYWGFDDFAVEGFQRPRNQIKRGMA